uniref:Uncharacterized protein n=1 Tax=Panagrolaimus sp. ES5 TaxID=591445 RepID=A0AC34G514_9BILA
MSVTATTSDLASLSFEEEQSPISVIISTIKKSVDPQDLIGDNKYAEPLKNYVTGLDDYRNVIYVEAEIEGNCLDHGSDPEKISCTLATHYGLPADSVLQLIGKKLGGHGKFSNLFPVNPNILADWKSDEDVVYKHVKKENCSASLIYGIKFDDEEEPRRPSDFYYHFQFFENGKSVGKAIERHIKNICIPREKFVVNPADFL